MATVTVRYEGGVLVPLRPLTGYVEGRTIEISLPAEGAQELRSKLDILAAMNADLVLPQDLDWDRATDRGEIYDRTGP